MNSVLVSGVDGFTGRYLAPLLANAGYEVHGLVQKDPALAVDGVARMHVADLLDAEAVLQVVDAAAPRGVIHLAGVSFVASDPETMYRVNLVGTRNLLEALTRLEVPPRAILLASSANVYGNASEGRLSEETSPAPANDYAVSKLAMEYLAKLHEGRLPLVICRPFNYTGVGQAETFLLPKIVSHVRRRLDRIELGNLDVARDFSDVREVAALYARLLETPEAIGTTLNICSGRAYTLQEVLELAQNIAGFRLQIYVNPAFVRPNEVKILLGDRSRLDALLPNWFARIPLDETLRWMIEY